MASQSQRTFAQRAQSHPHPLVKRLFDLAETKQSNIVLSADVTTTDELLKLANALITCTVCSIVLTVPPTELGPHIVVLKTHIDIINDLDDKTIRGLQDAAERHQFLIFEDRKFIDIGNTVQKQYVGGALRIHDWAHIVNASVLAGPGIIQALGESIKDGGNTDRAVLILAEMTSKGSLATGSYTSASVDFARQYPETVIGWVATRELSSFASQGEPSEDFVVFTTGVNIASKGDALGQQYQTPQSAMAGGSDFLIAGRGLYKASDPVAAAKEYKAAGWQAYQDRVAKA